MRLHEFVTTITDPRTRGRAIGRHFAAQLHDTSSRYLAHFEALGLASRTVRDVTEHSHDALRTWCPALAEESDGIAEGAGLEPWQVAAVGARTEVLAAAPPVPECTTAVHLPPAGGAPETIQTWDWHDRLAPEGLLLSYVTGTGRAVKLFTEFGAAAKIGVNDAGLGLHFNILHHRCDESTGGVPVHAVARRVLEEASTVAEAHELVASASISASTVLTVVDYHDGRAHAAALEMSPAGVAAVLPEPDGWLIHTNHFLNPALAAGDASVAQTLSVERYEHARSVRAAMAGLSPTERAAAFCGPDGADAIVCIRVDETVPTHEQWQTLLTISLDVPGFALEHLAATPDVGGREGLRRF